MTTSTKQDDTLNDASSRIDDSRGSQRAGDLQDTISENNQVYYSGTPVVMEFENADEPEFTNNFTKATTRLDNVFSFQQTLGQVGSSNSKRNLQDDIIPKLRLNESPQYDEFGKSPISATFAPIKENTEYQENDIRTIGKLNPFGAQFPAAENRLSFAPKFDMQFEDKKKVEYHKPRNENIERLRIPEEEKIIEISGTP